MPTETSASASEKTAKPPDDSLPPSAASKGRSCQVCRARKVRCDKQSPCSNCRRANIACIFPSADRPPRWARRLERVAKNAASNPQAPQEVDPAAAQVMERLRTLEGLVKQLSSQLELANSSGVNSPGSSASDPQREPSPNAGAGAGTAQKQFGRLVLNDSNKSRYVSSGFWSRVNDELDGLKIDSRGLGDSDSDTSEDEASTGRSPPTRELDRTPSERHAFLFRHNLGEAPDLREFHPYPSQLSFILDIFSENVNSIARVVHMPTVQKMIKNKDLATLSPSNQALMFSIYYSAITSMEEDDTMTNFGSSKADLNIKFRVGFEHALARADFLNVPNLTLVQALGIFLCLARRHDSPRFCWMMTGIVIRMAQALGLHRDGTHFKNLSPYEIEMRRRVWWGLCMLDVRASEDQGTDYTIPRGSFDTKLPSNINDADLDPNMTEMPVAREGVTDMTFSLVSCQITEVAKQMMAQSSKEAAPSLEEQTRLVSEIWQRMDKGYLQHSSETSNIAYWVAVNIGRLVMAKMTLLVFLPVLFSSPSDHFSDNIRGKLLASAIEVAEFNHALNAEPRCRGWRWVYQTYTHWHAVVYLLIEVTRRPWSPIVERAWKALHSQWLIPRESHMEKNLRVWLPLRKLMAKARKHRDAEILRIRNDPDLMQRLEMEDQKLPLPASFGPFPEGSNVVELFRDRWRKLFIVPDEPEYQKHLLHVVQEGTSPSAFSTNPSQQSRNPSPGFVNDNTFQTAYTSGGWYQSDHYSQGSTPFDSSINLTVPNAFTLGSSPVPSYTTDPQESWSMDPGYVPWLWPESDPNAAAFTNLDTTAMDVNMEMDSDVDWYGWVESAQGMEFDARQGGNRMA